MSKALTAWIEGIGFLAPGLPDWPTARAVLRGEQAYENAPSVLPAPAILPPAERRRASRVVKLTLAVGREAAAHAEADVAQLATVFSASGADGHNCHALCEQLAGEDRQISPTRFHNSVHNAAAGYWGIATGAMAPCLVICAYDASFGAGLLDALGHLHRRWHIGIGAEHQELLSAKAGCNVVSANAGLQQVGHLLQDQVAHRVAIAVVHVLEVVDVHHHQRHGFVGADGAGDIAVQRCDHRAPVGHAGE